ncbi:15153_t:CDS:2, partial [Cetraspora pellucida]
SARVCNKKSYVTDIILKVEKLFNDLEPEKIKVIALSTSTISLLNYSKDVQSTSIVQYTNDKSNYDEINNTNEDDEDDITLWSSISNNDSDRNLSGLESVDLDELLDSQESL